MTACTGSDCPVGTANSVCFLGSDGSVVDHSADVATGTTTDPVALFIDASGRLVFGPGTYRVSVAVGGDSLAIEGAGAEATVLAGSGPEGSQLYGTVISALGETTAIEISKLTIEDGSAVSGGGIYADQPGQSIAIRHVTMRDNQASGSNTAGGAVYAIGPLVVEDSRFAGNHGYMGGAIYAQGSLTIARSEFVGNNASVGGAVMSFAPTNELADCLFDQNTAYNGGGAVSLQGAGEKIDATLARNEFRSNVAETGGAIQIRGGTATLTELVLVGNHASGSGGALALLETSAQLDLGRVTGNSASGDDLAPLIGGAVALIGSELVVTSSTISANRATHGGGAVALQREGELGSVLVVEQSSFERNEGPAVGSPDIANLQLEGSTFSPDINAAFRCDLDGCR